MAGATIAGDGASGNLNRVTENYGTVSGGVGNQAGGMAGAIGGGADNRVNAMYGTVAGGWINQASGARAAVGGGQGNTASGIESVVAGGTTNIASGRYATIPGGWINSAAGDYSFAAGRRAKANAAGCFAWGDSTDADVTCSITNTWIVRASADMATGVTVESGSGSWSSVSDRNLKANLQPVDTQSVLQKVAAMPVSTWNYITQDESIRHMGPMAQDFATAFGVGEDDTHITTIDADGVALAAIQGLYAENQALKDESMAFKAENADQQAQIAGLEARLAALEQFAGGRPAPTAVDTALPPGRQSQPSLGGGSAGCTGLGCRTGLPAPAQPCGEVKRNAGFQRVVFRPTG